jgi:hypothetical protein
LSRNTNFCLALRREHLLAGRWLSLLAQASMQGVLVKTDVVRYWLLLEWPDLALQTA